MNNKNLIYTCFNENYLKFFKYLYYSFHKYEQNCDFLCITSKNIDLKSYKVFHHEVDSLNPMYTGRYLINEWEMIDEYENILYIDSDTIVLGVLDSFFKKIELDKNIFHALKENDSLNNANEIWNFDGRQFTKDVPSFNSGTFGFNKKIKEEVRNLFLYIEKNKNKAIHDQPLFNIFLYDKIKDSFSDNIELFENYKPWNPSLVHLFGGTNAAKEKNKIYKRFFRKETRGEILHLLPRISKVGVFNCGDSFVNEQLANIIKNTNRIIEVEKNEYDVNDEYYDFVFIETATSINNLIEIISKIYSKVKRGGIISSNSGDENCKKILKEFITKSNLDYYQCFEDDVFFTIKL